MSERQIPEGARPLGRALGARGPHHATRLSLVLSLTVLLAWPRLQAATGVAVWDTGTPFTDTIEFANRTGWQPVPADLLALEADPAKARSDPGYYGRVHTFKGDVVVGNSSLCAVFWSAQGRVVLYAKPPAAQPDNAAASATAPGQKIVEVLPCDDDAPGSRFSRCRIVYHVGDQVAIEATFAGGNAGERSLRFAFDQTGIMEIKPGQGGAGIRLRSPIDYGVVPGFIADDLILAPAEHATTRTLSLPSEHMFLGLLRGEGSMLVMTWPRGKQQLKVQLGTDAQGKRSIESVDFAPDGQSVYLAALQGPGVWHREELKAAHLEQDVAIAWRPPFPARWKTQLDETDVRTTFTFREGPGQIWRGVPGSYEYPVWFAGDKTLMHLSKKVPPKGEAIIYCVEGQDTPESILTPVDLLKATLGRAACEALVDPTGRSLRTHHRRGDDGVRRACTCGCTDAIQAVFQAGEEVARKPEICAAVDDMMFFVQRHVGRIGEYQRFADDLLKLLAAQGQAAPELKAFIEPLKEVAQQIPQECAVQERNMKSLAYADQLARQTVALTGQKDPNNGAAFKKLLDEWRAMGGAQDYVLARCHMITRKLFQEAGYGGLERPTAVDLAQEVRARCRQCLRNPDGYEIWPDY